MDRCALGRWRLDGKEIMRSNNARRRERNRKFVDSPLEEDGFELAVPPRRERLWRTTPGKHCCLGPEPIVGSAFRAAVSDCNAQKSLSQERDRWFESGSLQRGVWETDELDPGRYRHSTPAVNIYRQEISRQKPLLAPLSGYPRQIRRKSARARR